MNFREIIYDIFTKPIQDNKKLLSENNFFYTLNWKHQIISSLIFVTVNFLALENYSWSFHFVYTEIIKVFFALFGFFIFIEVLFNEYANRKKAKKIINSSK